MSNPLKTALAGSPSYWLHGPLATQARIDVPVPGGSGGALHLAADVTAYADGSFSADVQFNNDLTTILPSTGSTNPAAALPALQYTATINFQGMPPVTNTVSQIQYTDWHAVLNSAGAPMLNVSSSAGPAINVQHDLAYLEHTGAILPYDRTTGVANLPAQYGTAFYSIATVMASTGFGTPFAKNGLERYMGQTGGRPDIGYTTMWNTTWLLTQDPRAATVALALWEGELRRVQLEPEPELELVIAWLRRNTPKSKLTTLVHGDFKPGNVLMQGDSVTGLIDFYFACTDLPLYDLAVTHTAWTFDPAGDRHRQEVAEALLDGFFDVRTHYRADDLFVLPVLAMGACLRFALTRAWDWLNTPPDALVTRKDPLAYVRRLDFYRSAGLDPFT